MAPQLIDRIYECSFAPELWPGVLDELAKIATARAGFLFISNGDIHHFAASTEIGTEAVKPLVESGWIARSERFARLLGASSYKSGFLLDSELYTDEEKRTDPFYRDLIFPRGLGWAAATTVPLPTGDCFSISLEREYVRGPVELAAIQRLNELRPHVARSALMAARLQLERARAASEALALVRLPALVFGANGKVLAANRLIESMTSYIHWKARDRVSLKDRAADQLLRDAIATIDLDSSASVRSFPIRDVDTDAMMVVHVIPIRLSARDIFIRCAAVLVLTPVTLPQAPPVELVQSLFDLTPAEARVARNLASGKTVDDIASDGSISPNTIRTQIRGILEKTGCTRQVDVVALLTGISSARLMDPI
jgi:DNA-binding CsgD family transcriptional regulator